MNNKLLINLVTLRESQSDSLDDLINPDQVMFYLDNKLNCLNEIEHMYVKDLKLKLTNIFTIASKYDLIQWLDIFSHPN